MEFRVAKFEKSVLCEQCPMYGPESLIPYICMLTDLGDEGPASERKREESMKYASTQLTNAKGLSSYKHNVYDLTSLIVDQNSAAMMQHFI